MARKRSGHRRAHSALGIAPAPQNRYDAAGSGRRLSGWVAPGSGPNVAMSSGETLRNRMRDAIRNEWAARSAHRVWHVNLIGTGIIPRPRTKSESLKARLRQLWSAWTPYADADGVLDYFGLQTLAVKTWLASGECFVRLRPRRIDDGLDVPLQIQLLEPDMVPMSFNQTLPNGNRVRLGIEFDRIGRRVAYYMYRAHPGDDVRGEASLTELARVDADQIIHIFEPERPGQIRGVIDFASVLAKLRGVMNFDDAVLTRQELANLFTMFIKSPASTGNAPLDPLTGRPYEQSSAGPVAGLEPGMSQELEPGQEVQFSDPPDAGANYADYMREQHMGISAGAGVPYELGTGDIRDVSDRVLRVVINEFRRHCEQRQWQIIIPTICQRVRDAWARAVLLAGLITPDELADARDVLWSPQGWAYINPTQDVSARISEITSGLRARGQSITDRGDDPDDVDTARADDAAREKRLGLVVSNVEGA
ncbi:MAG: phage portal protein [Candidatus Dactylopiibacterium sp.]|nr:phage portal protein [Candidatus Dactylopiibacterium sp.]